MHPGLVEVVREMVPAMPVPAFLLALSYVTQAAKVRAG